MKLLARFQQTILSPKPFDVETERHFLRSYGQRFVVQRRVAVVIAVSTFVVYLSFGLYAAVVNHRLDEAARQIFQVRSVGMALLSFLVVFSVFGYFISLELERIARDAFSREHELQRIRRETEQNANELVTLKEYARLQMEQQNQDKSQFIANAAHDLRNTMQPVGNFLEVCFSAIARGDVLQARDYITDAISANKAMRTAVNALLDISELESGIIKIHTSHFDVRRLASEVLFENRAFARQRQVKLKLSNNRDLPAIVTSDRQHLKRILANLVSNAIKYADAAKGESATVAIAIVSGRRMVRIAVIDNGIGIPLREQGHIFKPLYQLNNPERNRDKGMGLGLAIVNTTLKLLDNHALKLTSKLGIGTRFSLSLPKGDAITQEEPQAVMAACSLAGLYVLVVENDLLVKKSIIALLQGHGAEYEAVGSLAALQALLPALAREFDVVVSDYRLPDDCTAAEVIATLQAAYARDLPTLIITGETADLSQVLPNRTILHKPADAKQLLAEINRLGHTQPLPQV